MDLYFYNKSRELVGIIDTAKSIQWLERYFEIGTFEVYVQVTQDVLDVVNQSYFVARSDSAYVGVIERIETEDDIDTGEFLVISGRFAESLIGRRIIRNITYLKGTLFYVCNELLQKNILNPVLQTGETISPRKMNCLNTTVVNKLIDNPTIEIQATFEDNLLEYIVDLLKIYNAGIRLELNSDGMFDIIIYQGIDRSYEQTENAYVVFSKEYDNLISSTYIFNSSIEKNALYVGGEDNETAAEGRYVEKYEYPVGDSVVSDIDRIEAFVNASDLKQTWKDEETDTEYTLTTDAYRNLLKARGKDNLVEPSEELNAKIDLYTYEYKKDYHLGDIVTILNTTQGVYSSKILLGMDIVDDENGHVLEPVLDDVFVLPSEEVSTEAVLLTENSEELLTESGQAILVESQSEEEISTYSVSETNSTTLGSVKISELPESTDLNDQCCMPVVNNGTTKKIYYSKLKEQLQTETNIVPIDSVELEALLD